MARGLDDLESEPADLDDGDAFRAIRTVGAALGRTVGAAGRRLIGAALGWITGMAIGRTICTAIATTVGAALGRAVGTTLRRAGLADVDCFEGCRERSTEPLGEIFVVGEGHLVGRVHVDRKSGMSLGIRCVMRRKLRHTEYMVEMSMSQHDTYRFQSMPADE